MQGVRGYRFGSFRMDCVERLVTHRGQRIALRGKAFELLALLASRAGHVVDKRALLDALWPGITVHDNNIAVTVRSLRKALEEHDPTAIETVPGRGYRLTRGAQPIATSPVALTALGAEQTGERAARAGAAERPPFVGREAEIERLSTLWAAARDGSGQVVFVSGEPGIGKSQLVRRFTELARAEAPLALALTGHSVQLFGAAEPHLPFLEALTGGLAGGARAELLEALAVHAPAWCARLGAARAARPGGADAALTWESPHLGPRELVDALAAASQSRPLLLVLEDMHWADASSVDGLRLLCSRAEGHALLVLATYRPADVRRARHPLGVLLDQLTGRENRQELALRAWSATHVVRYLAERFGDAALAGELASVLWQRTEGLPLFAVRLAESLVERGLVRQEAERWVLTLPAERLDLSASESVTAVIHGQLERLPAATRRALDMASVDGQEFGTALLSRLLGSPAAEVEEELERVARAHGLIERLGERDERGGALDVRYRFCHVLYRDHLYHELGSHRRLELHRRVAHVLSDARAMASPGRLAFHFERGRDYPNAVTFWTEAGDQADRAYAKLEALECYERAEGLLERLVEGERAPRRLVLEHGRGWANLGLGRTSAARQHFLAFARLAKELEAERSPAREAALTLASEYFQRPWADAVLQRPAGIFPRGTRHSVEVELHAEALHCCCHVASVEDRADALYEHASALRELAEAGRSDPRRAEALAWLGTHALSIGQAAEARRFLDEAISIARLLDHERALRLALGKRAWLDLMQGKLERARQGFEEFTTRVPDAGTAVSALAFLGEVLGKLGRPAAAAAVYGQADRLRQRMEPGFPALHGWLSRELGQLEAARELDAEAAMRLGSLDQRVLLARVLASLASTLCRQGALEPARQKLEQAEGLVAAEHRGCSWRMGGLWMARCELLAAEAHWEPLSQAARDWRASAQVRGDAEGVSVACRWLAHACFRNGDFRQAGEHVQAALEATRAHPIPLSDWRAHALFAQIAAAVGDAEGAAAAGRDARHTLGAIARELDPAERSHLERLESRELGELSPSGIPAVSRAGSRLS
jgi:DNA-binding winged helix-turn-helix (wHTH) protein/tetratricopeptide (TPR) repeat protein